MNQDSAHSEQDSPVADTAETTQVKKMILLVTIKNQVQIKMTPILLKTLKLN